MAQAIIDVTSELLCDLLFLPDGTEILYATLPEYPRTLRFVIDSPAVPMVGKGHVLPHVAPVFRKEQVPSTVTMVDWGLPKVGDAVEDGPA